MTRRRLTDHGMSGRRVVFTTVAAVVSTTGFAFVAFQAWFRHAETDLTVGILHALGVRRLNLIFGNSILVFPAGRPPIRAVVTPSCSALGSLLALAGLGLLATRCPLRRRLFAIVVALGVVQAGNLVRIGSAVWLGFLYGRGALVLFHDWVGSAFAFAYTLGGFLIYLWFLLPAGPVTEAQVAAHA